MCCASDADDWWLCTEDLAAPLQLLLWQPVYTGINLLKELKKRGYRATGTKRENRITKECPVAAKKTCWSSLKDLFNLQITQMMALSLHDGLITRSSPWPQPSMAWFQLQACSDIHRQKRKLSVYQDRAYLLHTIKEWEARVWPICSRLRMTASLRLRESFCLVTLTVGLIAWSLLPSQQFHISCHSLRISSLARGRKSMADTLTGDIGSDRAAFATLSALSFTGIPTWPGIKQSMTVLPEFVRVLYVLRYL